MKIRNALLISAVSFLTCLINHANANVTGMDYCSDGDGAIQCPGYSWGGGNTMNVYGDQFWGPAHVLGDVYTSDTKDPTITIASAVDNDTTFAWTDYHVNIYMSQNFTIVPGSVSVYNPVAGDWTAYLTQQPQWNGSQYVGNLDFYAGTPVAIGGELDFSYAIKFTGSTQYSFTQEMIPTPEPGMISFMLCGLLLGGRTLLRRR